MPDVNYKIEFMGWCNEHNHDKVWGWVSLNSDDTLYNFWGARGKKYTFKRFTEGYWSKDDLTRLSKDKMKPGRKNGSYYKVDENAIETVIPGFYEEFEGQLAMAKLFEKFHGETVAD